MKKKVLFALIALFSFVSAWADDVQAGDYTVSLQRYVALPATGLTANDVSFSVKKVVSETETTNFTPTGVYLADEDGKKVAEPIKTAGIYTLVIYITDGTANKVLRVQFYATASSSKYDFIKDETSWKGSYGNGALKKYYTKYPQEDLYGHNDWNATDHYAGFNDRVYEFTSYADADGNTQLATGTIRTIWTDEPNRWKVKVLTNSIDGFDGNEYFIARTAEVGTTLYELYSEASGDNGTGIYVKITAGPTFPGMTQCWAGAVNATNAMYPWIAPNFESTDFEEGAPKKIVFTYGEASVTPWGDKLFGLGVAGTDLDPADRLWGMASVAEEFENKGFLIPENAVLANFTTSADPTKDVRGKVNSWDGTLGANNFDITNFNMFLVPADLALAEEGSADDVTVLTTNDYELDYVDAFEFNGQVQKPLFSGQSPVADSFIYLKNGTEIGNALKEGVDFEVIYSNPESKTVNDYTFTINFIGNYNGTASIVNKPYRINGKSIAINLAYIYKTYGEPDPEVVSEDYFEVDPGALLGNDTKADIAQWLVVKRATGKEGEDVGQYEYYYDFTPEYYTECQYKIIPLQTTSNLIIRKAPLEIKVTNNWKKYKQNDPETFAYTIVNENQLKRGDKAADVDAVVKRAYSLPDNDETAVNATLIKENNVDVAVHTDGKPVYAFDLEKEATNYAITFANNFEIVPSDDYSGIQVTVTNLTGDATSNPNFSKPAYIYRGTAYEPGKTGTAEVNHLVVTDNGNTLTAGVDYNVKSYANNIHVGAENAATVTITLTGSYVEKDVNGTFTIKEAPLTITAKSYTLGVGDPDPATFEVLYDGFVENESYADNQPESGKVRAKGFKAPSGVTKKAIPGSTGSTLSVIEDAEADDYEIKYEDGGLSFGETILIVKADNKSKTYGETDPDLTVTVKKAVDAGEVDATEGEKAALNIGGTLAYTVTREKGENVDGGSNANKTYPISVDGPKKLLDGVIVVYRPGEFDINVKTVTLKGDNATKVYGDANPTFEASVWEVPAGETDPTKATKWSDEKKAEEGVINPNFYYVGVQGAHYTSSGNYLVVIGEAGKFSITPAPLTIKADDKSKSFGEADPALTITATGLKLNDQLQTPRDYTIARAEADTEAGENVGTYTITVTPVENAAVLKNYTVTLETGTLTIGAMELAVIANDQAIYYGQKINPYDVTIIIKGQPVVWTVDQIKEVLSLSTTVRKVGFNKDAFTLNKVKNANYNIADDAFTNGWLTIGQLKEIPLGKADLAKITDVELQQVLEDHKGLIVDVVLPSDRSMSANEWYSWVLPFNVTPRDFFYPIVTKNEDNEITDYKDSRWGLGAIELLDLAKSKNSNAVFTLTMDEIPANTPFIVKVDETVSAEKMGAIRFKNVTIANTNYVDADGNAVNPTAVSDDNNVKFIGLYTPKTGVDATEWILNRESATTPRKFLSGPNDKVTLSQTRAYLKFGSEVLSANARITVEEPDGTTTVINGVDADAEVAYGEGWYTINGIKLEGEPTTSGTYIFNGKKVFIQK